MKVERVRAGEVLALQRRDVAIDPIQDYRLIGVYSFGRGIFHREAVSGASLGDYRFFKVEPGDLVLSNIQAWEGAIAHATDVDRGTIGTHRFLTYVAIDDRIDTSWARWFFLSEPGFALIRKAAPGTVQRNRTLSIDRFEALEIPLPPIDEQRQVAERIRSIASQAQEVQRRHNRSATVARAVPTSLRSKLEAQVPLTSTKLGDVLEHVRDAIDIDPVAPYVTIGIRSFGKGVFHYPLRPGAEIGKLRFQKVAPRLLAISNIKAWEGAVATTQDSDRDTVASNRFLFFRPVAGEDAAEFFWSLLLGGEGLAALGQASPGSADRNRTLAVDRFRGIKLRIPKLEGQAEIGRRLREVRTAIARHEAASERAQARIEALVPAALNQAFAGLS